MISLDPIAYFHARESDKADLPRQGCLEVATGVIRFLPGKNYEQALEDLEGMERIWVLYWMHKVTNMCLKVQPPRSTGKKGVFATRSPHRPNPIGLSCVRLLSVSSLDLHISEHDLLDGSPILDIKPYIAYADSFPSAKSGWVDLVTTIQPNVISWVPLALEQLQFLGRQGQEMQKNIERRLHYFEAPSSCNRIKKVGDDLYICAYKEWRLLLQKIQGHISIFVLYSVYDPESLLLGKVPLHDQFMQAFRSQIQKILVGL